MPEWFPMVTLDQFVIMQNHIHAILQLDTTEKSGSPPTLSTVIGSFKSAVSRRAHESLLLPQQQAVWQRGLF